MHSAKNNKQFIRSYEFDSLYFHFEFVEERTAADFVGGPSR